MTSMDTHDKLQKNKNAFYAHITNAKYFYEMLINDLSYTCKQ